MMNRNGRAPLRRTGQRIEYACIGPKTSVALALLAAAASIKGDLMRTCGVSKDGEAAHLFVASASRISSTDLSLPPRRQTSETRNTLDSVAFGPHHQRRLKKEKEMDGSGIDDEREKPKKGGDKPEEATKADKHSEEAADDNKNEDSKSDAGEKGGKAEKEDKKTDKGKGWKEEEDAQKEKPKKEEEQEQEKEGGEQRVDKKEKDSTISGPRAEGKPKKEEEKREQKSKGDSSSSEEAADEKKDGSKGIANTDDSDGKAKKGKENENADNEENEPTPAGPKAKEKPKKGGDKTEEATKADKHSEEAADDNNEDSKGDAGERGKKAEEKDKKTDNGKRGKEEKDAQKAEEKPKKGEEQEQEKDGEKQRVDERKKGSTISGPKAEEKPKKEAEKREQNNNGDRTSSKKTPDDKDGSKGSADIDDMDGKAKKGKEKQTADNEGNELTPAGPKAKEKPKKGGDKTEDATKADRHSEEAADNDKTSKGDAGEKGKKAEEKDKKTEKVKGGKEEEDAQKAEGKPKKGEEPKGKGEEKQRVDEREKDSAITGPKVEEKPQKEAEKREQNNKGDSMSSKEAAGEKKDGSKGNPNTVDSDGKAKKGREKQNDDNEENESESTPAGPKASEKPKKGNDEQEKAAKADKQFEEATNDKNENSKGDAGEKGKKAEEKDKKRGNIKGGKEDKDAQKAEEKPKKEEEQEQEKEGGKQRVDEREKDSTVSGPKAEEKPKKDVEKQKQENNGNNSSEDAPDEKKDGSIGSPNTDVSDGKAKKGKEKQNDDNEENEPTPAGLKAKEKPKKGGDDKDNERSEEAADDENEESKGDVGEKGGKSEQNDKKTDKDKGEKEEEDAHKTKEKPKKVEEQEQEKDGEKQRVDEKVKDSAVFGPKEEEKPKKEEEKQEQNNKGDSTSSKEAADDKEDGSKGNPNTADSDRQAKKGKEKQNADNKENEPTPAGPKAKEKPKKEEEKQEETTKTDKQSGEAADDKNEGSGSKSNASESGENDEEEQKIADEGKDSTPAELKVEEKPKKGEEKQDEAAKTDKPSKEASADGGKKGSKNNQNNNDFGGKAYKGDEKQKADEEEKDSTPDATKMNEITKKGEEKQEQAIKADKPSTEAASDKSESSKDGVRENAKKTEEKDKKTEKPRVDKEEGDVSKVEEKATKGKENQEKANKGNGEPKEISYQPMEGSKGNSDTNDYVGEDEKGEKKQKADKEENDTNPAGLKAEETPKKEEEKQEQATKPDSLLEGAFDHDENENWNDNQSSHHSDRKSKEGDEKQKADEEEEDSAAAGPKPKEKAEKGGEKQQEATKADEPSKEDADGEIESSMDNTDASDLGKKDEKEKKTEIKVHESSSVDITQPLGGDPKKDSKDIDNDREQQGKDGVANKVKDPDDNNSVDKTEGGQGSNGIDWEKKTPNGKPADEPELYLRDRAEDSKEERPGTDKHAGKSELQNNGKEEVLSEIAPSDDKPADPTRKDGDGEHRKEDVSKEAEENEAAKGDPAGASKPQKSDEAVGLGKSMHADGKGSDIPENDSDGDVDDKERKESKRGSAGESVKDGYFQGDNEDQEDGSSENEGGSIVWDVGADMDDLSERGEDRVQEAQELKGWGAEDDKNAQASPHDKDGSTQKRSQGSKEDISATVNGATEWWGGGPTGNVKANDGTDGDLGPSRVDTNNGGPKGDNKEQNGGSSEKDSGGPEWDINAAMDGEAEKGDNDGAEDTPDPFEEALKAQDSRDDRSEVSTEGGGGDVKQDNNADASDSTKIGGNNPKLSLPGKGGKDMGHGPATESETIRDSNEDEKKDQGSVDFVDSRPKWGINAGVDCLTEKGAEGCKGGKSDSAEVDKQIKSSQEDYEKQKDGASEKWSDGPKLDVHTEDNGSREKGEDIGTPGLGKDADNMYPIGRNPEVNGFDSLDSDDGGNKGNNIGDVSEKGRPFDSSDNGHRGSSRGKWDGKGNCVDACDSYLGTKRNWCHYSTSKERMAYNIGDCEGWSMKWLDNCKKACTMSHPSNSTGIGHTPDGNKEDLQVDSNDQEVFHETTGDTKINEAENLGGKLNKAKDDPNRSNGDGGSQDQDRNDPPEESSGKEGSKGTIDTGDNEKINEDDAGRTPDKENKPETVTNSNSPADHISSAESQEDSKDKCKESCDSYLQTKRNWCDRSTPKERFKYSITDCKGWSMSWLEKCKSQCADGYPNHSNGNGGSLGQDKIDSTDESSGEEASNEIKDDGDSKKIDRDDTSRTPDKENEPETVNTSDGPGKPINSVESKEDSKDDCKGICDSYLQTKRNWCDNSTPEERMAYDIVNCEGWSTKWLEKCKSKCVDGYPNHSNGAGGSPGDDRNDPPEDSSGKDGSNEHEGDDGKIDKDDAEKTPKKEDRPKDVVDTSNNNESSDKPSGRNPGLEGIDDANDEVDSREPGGRNPDSDGRDSHQQNVEAVESEKGDDEGKDIAKSNPQDGTTLKEANDKDPDNGKGINDTENDIEECEEACMNKSKAKHEWCKEHGTDRKKFAIVDCSAWTYDWWKSCKKRCRGQSSIENIGGINYNQIMKNQVRTTDEKYGQLSEATSVTKKKEEKESSPPLVEKDKPDPQKAEKVERDDSSGKDSGGHQEKSDGKPTPKVEGKEDSQLKADMTEGEGKGSGIHGGEEDQPSSFHTNNNPKKKEEKESSPPLVEKDKPEPQKAEKVERDDSSGKDSGGHQKESDGKPPPKAEEKEEWQLADTTEENGNGIHGGEEDQPSSSQATQAPNKKGETKDDDQRQKDKPKDDSPDPAPASPTQSTSKTPGSSLTKEGTPSPIPESAQSNKSPTESPTSYSPPASVATLPTHEASTDEVYIDAFGVELSVALYPGEVPTAGRSGSPDSLPVVPRFSAGQESVHARLVLEDVLVHVLDQIIREDLGWTTRKSKWKKRRLGLRFDPNNSKTPLQDYEDAHDRRRKLVTLQHDPDMTTSSSISIDSSQQSRTEEVKWISFRMFYDIVDFTAQSDAFSSIDVSVKGKETEDNMTGMSGDGNRPATMQTLSGTKISTSVRKVVASRIRDGTLLEMLWSHLPRVVAVSEVGNESTTPLDFSRVFDLPLTKNDEQEEIQELEANMWGVSRLAGVGIFVGIFGLVVGLAQWAWHKRRQHRAEQWVNPSHPLQADEVYVEILPPNEYGPALSEGGSSFDLTRAFQGDKISSLGNGTFSEPISEGHPITSAYPPGTRSSSSVSAFESVVHNAFPSLTLANIALESNHDIA